MKVVKTFFFSSVALVFSLLTFSFLNNAEKNSVDTFFINTANADVPVQGVYVSETQGGQGVGQGTGCEASGGCCM